MLAGLSALVYLFNTTLRAVVFPGSLALPSWPATLFSFTAGSLLAYWGIRGMRHFLVDVLRPASTYEGHAEWVEVTWVTTSRNKYHQWTLFAGGQAWSVPTTQKEENNHDK